MSTPHTGSGVTLASPGGYAHETKNPPQRPPLGPNARKNLGFFALLTLAHTLATVVFSAALACVIARAAYAGFAALTAEHARMKANSTPEEYRALVQFAGDAQAKLDGVLPWLLNGGDTLSVGLVVTGVVALLVRAGMEYLLSVSAQRAASGAKSSIRKRLLERVLATGGADTPEGTGASAVLISRGLDALDNYYTKTLTALVASAVVPATLWVVLLLLDPTSAITVACTLPLIPLFMVLIGKTTREDTAAAQSELHRLSDHILELVRGLPVLIGLGRERAQTRALAAIGEKYRARTMHILRSAFMSSLALELITTISVALVAVLIGVRLVNGQMGLDTAILVLLLAPECYQPLRDAGAAYHQSEEGVAALRSAQAVIDTPLPAAVTGAGASGSSDVPVTSTTREGCAVENLSVTYPNRAPVLEGVSFTLPGAVQAGAAPQNPRQRTGTGGEAGYSSRGTVLGIVGPSGCGKSTLLGVLSGAVRNGLVPSGYDEAVRVTGTVSGLGCTLTIGQDPQFTAATVLGEVALYGLSASAGERERAAQLLAGQGQLSQAESALLGSYLNRLGLGRLSGQAPEALSAGQARRLAVARVLARADALRRGHKGAVLTVLVDEPTAHLDAHAAALVTGAIFTLAERGANVLLVTHEGQLAGHCDAWLRACTQPSEGTPKAGACGGQVIEGLERKEDKASYTWVFEPNPAPTPVPGGSAEQAQNPEHDPVSGQHSADNTGHALKTCGTVFEESMGGDNAGHAEYAGCVEGTAQSTARTPGVLTTFKTLRSITGLGVFASAGPVVMAALTSLSAVALTALSGWLIVRAAEGPAMMYLMVAIVGVRFFGLGRAAARYAERLLTHARVLSAANTLRLRAWAGAYRNVGSVRALLRGDALLERLIGGIDELRDGIPRVVLPPAAHLLVMVAALVTTALVLPQAFTPVALAVLVSTVITPWVVVRADAHAEGASRASTAQLMRLSTSVLGAAEDARANGVAATAVAAAGRVDARNLRALRRGSYAQGAGRALAVVAWFGAALWCAVIAYPLVVSGTVGAPESAIVVLMCTGMVESTVGAVEAVRSWPAFARLVAKVAAGVHGDGTTASQGDSTGAKPLRGEIPADTRQENTRQNTPSGGGEPALELVDAAARWPGMGAPVFEHLNVKAYSGQWAGITGPSGSGKSTALAALLGFLPLEQGAVRVRGEQLGVGSLGAQQLRGYAAWCPQAAHIFESTLEGNLLLARDRKNRPSRGQMVQALRRVGLGEWFDALPDGLSTRVGAGGRFLSGGQRQRLAVARALLVEAPVLLLDEPTAHLDEHSARVLMADVRVATDTAGVATVLVSHRRQDIAYCDAVVRLGCNDFGGFGA